jgi:hypothetical protein
MPRQEKPIRLSSLPESSKPSNSSLEWRGFDTETQEGKAILCTTDKTALPFPRGFIPIARWLAEQGERFACWNMDYDARAILLYLPWNKLSELHYTNWTRYRKWKIHYLPRKVLELFPPTADLPDVVKLFDVHQFFGGSLRSAAPRVGMEKHDVPKSWYHRMAWALRHHREKVIEYGINDAKIAERHAALLLPRLMEFAGCENPYSPAAVARSYFGKRLKFRETKWQQETFKTSYRGGRIEVFKRGRCGGGVLYDIRSAYPAALASALDPRHMIFARTGRFSKDAFYGSYLITVNVPPMPISPLAYTAQVGGERTTVFPTGDLELVVDRETLCLLRQLGMDPEIKDGWEYLVEKKVPLFQDIPMLFERRKKEKDLDLAIKLTLNGLYGILCQNIETWIKPKHVTEYTRRHGGEYREKFERIANTTHYAVGSYITAHTRRRVFELATRDAKNVLFIATDGVGFRGKGPRGVRTGSNLGDWSVAHKFEDSLIVGAGVYSLKIDGEWKDKTRGFYAPGVRLLDLLDTTRKQCSVPATAVDTLADGMRERSAQLNVVRTVRKNLDFNFDRKRVWDREYSGRELLTHCYESTPWRIEE